MTAHRRTPRLSQRSRGLSSHALTQAQSPPNVGLVAAPALEHTYLSSNGVTLHVVRAGPADGPLLILLHGFPEFWFAWRRYIAAFAQAGFRVIAPDQRGYNLSDKPLRVSDYTFEALSADVLGLIDSEGRKTAHLVGHDWGAAVTWWTAIHHPDRVERAITMNVPHPEVLRRSVLGGQARQMLKSWYMFYFQLPWLPERAFAQDSGRRQFERMAALAGPGTFDAADAEAYRQAWAQPGASRAMVDWYRAAFRSSLKPPTGSLRVTVPMQMIWGRQDALLGDELVQPSLDLCDRGAITWFDAAGHFVQHEAFEGVLKACLDFLPS